MAHALPDHRAGARSRAGTVCRTLTRALLPLLLLMGPASAEERLPWLSGGGSGNSDSYAQGYGSSGNYDADRSEPRRYDDAYRPSGEAAGGDRYYDDRYRSGDPPPQPYVDQYRRGEAAPAPEYQDRRGRDRDDGPGEPYAPPRRASNEPYERGYGGRPRHEDPGLRPYEEDRRSYSQGEIVGTGHRFFGSVSSGLASVIEYAFKKSGRPNGYILGEDAGGAFVAGLRYGEGVLYTKDAGQHKVYWQGPSVGYDFGAEGSKTMVLVYNLRHPSEIYTRFGGVQGSAYVIGGVSIQFQKYGDIVLAPIRSGVGLRLGANVGYLKYTRRPTWNPF